MSSSSSNNNNSNTATLEGSVTVDNKTLKIKVDITSGDLPPPPHQCDPGFHWDDVQQKCVPDSTETNPFPLPASGRPQPEKGANQDPHTWKAVQMTNPPTQFKVVDAANINVADQFASEADAKQYINHYIWEVDHVTPPPPPHDCDPGFHWDAAQGKCVKDDVSPPPTGQFPYTAKPGGYKQTQIDTQQGDCEGDGKRYNIKNNKNVINYHAYWFMTLVKDVTSSCTDKPWWSPKLGSHGKSGEKTFLIEASTFWKGGLKGCRMEGPHGTYESFPASAVKAMKDVPKMPVGKQVGIYVVNFLTKDEKNYITQFFYDFENGGKGPWILYATVTDTPKGVISGHPPLEGSPGHYTLVGAADNCKSTMRGNGMTATLQGGAVEEIIVPDNIIGGQGLQAIPLRQLREHAEEDDCTIEG